MALVDDQQIPGPALGDASEIIREYRLMDARDHQFVVMEACVGK